MVIFWNLLALTAFALAGDEVSLAGPHAVRLPNIGEWAVEHSPDFDRPGTPVICIISQSSVRLTIYGGQLAQVELDRPVSNTSEGDGTNRFVRMLRLDGRRVRIAHRYTRPVPPIDGRPYIDDPLLETSFSLDGRHWRDLLALPEEWLSRQRLEIVRERRRRTITIDLRYFADAARRCGFDPTINQETANGV